jgi:hypothetical protein
MGNIFLPKGTLLPSWSLLNMGGLTRKDKKDMIKLDADLMEPREESMSFL